MPEEIALQPILESPFTHLVVLLNLHALTGFKGNRQLVVDGQLLFRQAGQWIAGELPVCLDGRGNEIVAKTDGAFHALQTDFLQLAFAAAIPDTSSTREKRMQ